jgi:hypothetical protein
VFYLDDDDSRGIPDTETARVLQLKIWKRRRLSQISLSLFLVSVGIGYNLGKGVGGKLDFHPTTFSKTAEIVWKLIESANEILDFAGG